MSNLLESLLQSPIKVADKKNRLTIQKRDYPARPRDLLDMFAAMGHTASIEGLLRGIEYKKANPRSAYFAVLGRWPTPSELAALPSPYKPAQHLRQLVVSQEFRASIAARLFAAFPERRRLLFVRLPRCAGEAAIDALQTHHPVLPLELDDASYRDPAALVPLLGNVGVRFDSTSSLALALPSLAPFVTAGAAPPLRWCNAEPLCRATDLLFTILRPPRDLALSSINAALAALRAGGAADLRGKIGPLPAPGNIAAWRALGLTLLPDLVAPNPVCHALADGTAAGALAMCACVPIQLIALSHFDEWARVALGPADAPRQAAPPSILRHDDLTPRDRETIDRLTAEDRDFYYRFESKLAASALPSVAGHALE